MLTTGQKIKRLRKSKGMSQAQFSEYLGVSWRAFSEWERDAALPDANSLLKIARKVGLKDAFELLHDDLE